MEEIDGDLDHFSVDPRLYAPLRSFSCGKRGSRPEEEVNRMVREYSRGKRKCENFRVTVELPSRLAGVAAFQAAYFSHPALAQLNGYPYLAVIGLSQSKRSCCKNGRRIGDFVLDDVLRAINEHGRWGEVPDVFALVDQHNDSSTALLSDTAFSS
jgi:hypothetical protein